MFMTLFLVLTTVPVVAEVEYTFEDTFDSESSLDNWTAYAVDWDPSGTNDSIITTALPDTWEVVDGQLVTTISPANLITEHLWRESTMSEGAWSFDVTFGNFGGTGIVFSLAYSSYGIPNWNNITTDNFDDNETTFDLNFYSSGLRLDEYWVEDGEGTEPQDFLSSIDWENGFSGTTHHIDILIDQNNATIFVDNEFIIENTFARDYPEITAFGIWAWGPLSLDNVQVTEDYDAKLTSITGEAESNTEAGTIALLISISTVTLMALSYRYYFSKKKL